MVLDPDGRLTDRRVHERSLAGAVGVNRREVIAGLVGGGLGALTPGRLEADHPVHRHLGSGAAVDAARKAAESPDWTPAFLSPHQSATLEAVAERLVPGSTAARVHRFVDKLLAIETQDTQRRFLESLSAFDATALEQSGRPVLSLGDTERDAVLEMLSVRAAAAPAAPAPIGSPPITGGGGPGRAVQPFSNMKGWVSGAYYSSEVGMRELGWTGNTFFPSFPGCTHPEGHE
jgi:hypothetical protein